MLEVKDKEVARAMLSDWPCFDYLEEVRVSTGRTGKKIHSWVFYKSDIVKEAFIEIIKERKAEKENKDRILDELEDSINITK